MNIGELKQMIDGLPNDMPLIVVNDNYAFGCIEDVGVDLPNWGKCCGN